MHMVVNHSAGNFMPTHNRKATVIGVVVAAFLLLAAGTALAQGTGSAIQGTVTDEQGAVMPGATVVVANVETGWTRDLITDERGWYRATAIPPGDYKSRVTLQGFATQIRRGLTVTVGQEATVNVALRVANVEESVTVTGAAPLVETTRSTLGTTVTRESLDNLPLITRNFAGLATLAPGVTGVGGGGVTAQGQTDRSNSYMVDGVSNDQIVTAGNRGGFSLEAVREFAVMTNQFSAEYGLSSGAVFTVITRSGTNDLNGRVFAFHRGDALDAQNPFSKAQGSGKAPFSQQRFGGFLGGPIVRDRLHYFGSYEGSRQRETTVITASLVPVDRARNAQPDRRPPGVHQARWPHDREAFDVAALPRRQEQSTGNGIGGLEHPRARHQHRFAGAGHRRQHDDDPVVAGVERVPLPVRASLHLDRHRRLEHRRHAGDQPSLQPPRQGLQPAAGPQREPVAVHQQLDLHARARTT